MYVDLLLRRFLDQWAYDHRVHGTSQAFGHTFQEARKRVTSVVSRTGQLGGLGLLLAAHVGCGHAAEPDCVVPPCPIPLAIVINSTSAAGGPVANLLLTVSGASTGFGPCSAGDALTQCRVSGTAGTYNLRLTAAGFEEKAFSVTIEGSSPPCGCPTVQPQQIDVVLTPR
jgi:hypothetical protein